MSLLHAAVLSWLAAIAAVQDVQVLVDDFDNVGWGTRWVTVGIAGAAARPEVAGLAAGGHDGHGCAQVSVGAHSRLSIRREVGKGFVGNGDKEPLSLPGRPSKIGLWVKGNGTATRLVADVSGAGIDFGTCQATEWTFVERDLPAISESPVRLRSLTFGADAVAEVDSPAIAIDDLVVTTRADERTPLFIEVRSARPLSCSRVHRNRPARFCEGSAHATDPVPTKASSMRRLASRAQPCQRGICVLTPPA